MNNFVKIYLWIAAMAFTILLITIMVPACGREEDRNNLSIRTEDREVDFVPRYSDLIGHWKDSENMHYYFSEIGQKRYLWLNSSNSLNSLFRITDVTVCNQGMAKNMMGMALNQVIPDSLEIDHTKKKLGLSIGFYNKWKFHALMFIEDPIADEPLIPKGYRFMGGSEVDYVDSITIPDHNTIISSYGGNN